MNRKIFITTSFKGIHNWPECPFEEVKFLRDLHRHTFQVKVMIEVQHHDREIEFFVFQQQVNGAINSLYGLATPKMLGRKSCETIADEIHDVIGVIYPHRAMSIEVSEDGEVGALVEYDA